MAGQDGVCLATYLSITFPFPCNSNRRGNFDLCDYSWLPFVSDVSSTTWDSWKSRRQDPCSPCKLTVDSCIRDLVGSLFHNVCLHGRGWWLPQLLFLYPCVRTPMPAARTVATHHAFLSALLHACSVATHHAFMSALLHACCAAPLHARCPSSCIKRLQQL
jgi:hypothetical protein